MAPKQPEYPCIRCKRNVGKVKSVSCGTCGLWVHKECEEMSDELFAELAGKYGGVKWHCSSCEASTARLEAAIKQVETRLNKVEDRMDRADERAKVVDVRVEKAEMVAEQAKKAVEGVKDDITRIVFEEMREREEKKTNIIMHNVGEAENGEQMWDANSFDNIMRAMNVNMSHRNSVNFTRRLGAAGGARARPLLVGLKKEDDKQTILEHSKRLDSTQFRNISIVPDLTKQQREADNELRKEADRRNREELTEDDKSKNVRWVAVGKKGMRRLSKREVRDNSHPDRTREHQNRKRPADRTDLLTNKRNRSTAVGAGVGEGEGVQEMGEETTTAGEV